MVSEISGGQKRKPVVPAVHLHVCVCVFVRQRESETERERECVCACIKKTRERSLRQPAHLLSHL